MKATFRALILAAVGAVVLSASAVAQTPLGQGKAAYDAGDYATALRLWRPLADQGSAAAQLGLGDIYARGLGVQLNYAEAVRWYRLAADQGQAEAQLRLGIQYALGEGVPKNIVEAYKWLNLAAAQGNSAAAESRDLLRYDITLAQIAEAQKLAAEWKPRK